jgi:alpha-methylacyl-CoA racemase
MAGPLHGIRVVELAGLGPGPFCGMVMADLGADVVRVDRADQVTGGHTTSTRHDLHNRGKRSIGIDLKHPRGVEVMLGLVGGADALIEGFRPGVAERLGVGPADCLSRNPGLVYGRVTGWGQEGPLADQVGHDIDYIAISGALGSIGTEEAPVPPLNLVGDYGGGGMLLAVGLLAAIISARETGAGQVVDAAMVDGSALLTTALHGFVAEGWWRPRRASNLLDGGAPFYSVYRTADGGHVAVGAIEPRFFEALLRGLGLDPGVVGDQSDRTCWPEMRSLLGARFLEHDRHHWESVFSGSDACVAPVLDLVEARTHPHNAHRGTFVDVDGVSQPAPAPRFGSTSAEIGSGPCFPGQHTDFVLQSLGFSRDDTSKLRTVGAVA